MGRNPKVTRNEALHLAMKTFWSRGYSATTMDDLQESTGLQRGSLYSYFKTKEDLFREALELYQSEVVEKRRELVRQATTAKLGIALFFSELIEHSLKNRKHPGCLNTNTAAELSVIDESVGSMALKGLQSWESFWIEILENAKLKGEVAKKIDSRSAARLLITLTQGINIVSKVNPNREYLYSIAQASQNLI